MNTYVVGNVEINYSHFFGCFKIFHKGQELKLEEMSNEVIEELITPFFYPDNFPYEEFKNFLTKKKHSGTLSVQQRRT